MRMHVVGRDRPGHSLPLRRTAAQWGTPDRAALDAGTVAADTAAQELDPAGIVSMQRAAGNAAVCTMLLPPSGPGDTLAAGHIRHGGSPVERAGLLGDDENDEPDAGQATADTPGAGVGQWIEDTSSDTAGALASGVGAAVDTTSDIASDVGAEQTSTGGAGTSSTMFGPPTNSTYTVSGSLLDAANAIAARTEAGLTTSTPSLDTDTLDDKVTAARVAIAEDVQLPEWSDRAKGNAQQQAEWDRFHSAIATHEAGHVQRDRTSWANAHTKLVGKSAADANTTFDKISAAADATNAQYDTDTDHGKKQGTTINPNVGTVTKVP